MSMDWENEQDKIKAAQAMNRKPSKKNSSIQKQTAFTVDSLLKRPYCQVVRFKKEHPDVYRRLFNGETFELRPDWFSEDDTPYQIGQKLMDGQIIAKKPVEEELPVKSLEEMTLEEVEALPKSFWVEYTRQLFKKSGAL